MVIGGEETGDDCECFHHHKLAAMVFGRGFVRGMIEREIFKQSAG